MASISAAELARLMPDPPGPAVPPAAPVPQTPQQNVRTGLELVAAYIPAQALAVFVAVYGYFNPPETAPLFRAALVVAGAALVVCFIWAGFDFKTRTLSARRRRQMTWLIVLGVIAFLAWVLAMPAGPLAGSINVLGMPMTTNSLGGGLVLVFAAGLPKAAKFLKLRLPSSAT